MSADLFAAPPALTPAGERIVAAAADLFYARGIRAVGVDTIAETAGTTKKTLYDCFGSKDALVAAYLVRRARDWQAVLAAELARHRPGRTRVLAVFDALGLWLVDRTRGCAFVNAYAEYGGLDDPVTAIVRAEKQWMHDRFVALVAEAGIAAPARVGATVHLLYEGALVTSTAGGDDASFAVARSAADRVLRG